MQRSPDILTPAEVAPSSPVSPPTHQESLQLASLVPLSAAQDVPESVLDIVSAVFKLCRDRWVADFLFSKDMTPLSALTAPVNLNHAITCTVTMTSVERFIGLPRCEHAPPNPFDIHLHGDYVFIPAFSVGPISVGFGIQNCAIRCHADWGLRPGQRHNTALNHFRYVRDDQKGILVNIRDEWGSDFYKVDYMAHATASKRRRTFLTIDRTAVQNLLAEQPEGLDPHSLVKAVRLVQAADEFRDCPFCGSPKGAFCNCKVELKTAKHPLDFDNMLVNMSSHLGSFEGITAARFCTAGMELLSAKLGSRITIDCRLDSDLLDKLSNWAITDQLKHVREDPLKCIMPAPDQEMTDTGVAAVGSGDVTEIDVGAEVPEEDLEVMREVDAFVDEMTLPMKSFEFVGDVTRDGLDNIFGSNKDPLGAIPTQQMLERLSPTTTDGDDEVHLANEIAREAQIAYQAENQLGEHSDPSGASTTVVQGLGGYSPQHDMANLEEARRQQEKERKAVLRRQRNREAAQRSNAKRKEKNDTLKAALRASHDKATELRAKELMLREENIQLRRRLAESMRGPPLVEDV